MRNIRITDRKLADGSTVCAVKFEALGGDCEQHTVTLECNSASDAHRLSATLMETVAYAEADASPQTITADEAKLARVRF